MLLKGLYALILSFSVTKNYRTQILCGVTPYLEAIREILSSLHNPILLKFANSHVPYGKEAKYREMLKDASIEKLAKILRAVAILAQMKVYLFWVNPEGIN
jgi:hypothetical protein